MFTLAPSITTRTRDNSKALIDCSGLSDREQIEIFHSEIVGEEREREREGGALARGTIREKAINALEEKCPVSKMNFVYCTNISPLKAHALHANAITAGEGSLERNGNE